MSLNFSLHSFPNSSLVFEVALHYKQGILNIIKYNLSNARAERFNGAIQKLNRVAQGYRNFDNLRIAILFFNGKFNFIINYPLCSTIILEKIMVFIRSCGFKAITSSVINIFKFEFEGI